MIRARIVVHDNSDACIRVTQERRTDGRVRWTNARLQYSVDPQEAFGEGLRPHANAAGKVAAEIYSHRALWAPNFGIPLHG